MRSVQPRYTCVHADEIDRCMFNEIQAFLVLGDTADHVNFPVLNEERKERFLGNMVVTDDQGAYFVHPYSLRTVGNEHLIVVPLPGLLLIEKDPLIRCARSCIDINP